MSYNLPPGCSVRDIDRAAGCYPERCIRCCEEVIAYSLEEGLCRRCVKEEEMEKMKSDN